MSAILPNSTIGILGGGQLGRMVAISARTLGYRVNIMDPDPACPAAPFADICVPGGWGDAEPAVELAKSCAVLTLEIEQISVASLRAAEAITPVRPSSALMAIVQDRILQKQWLQDHALPVGSWAPVPDLQALEQRLAELKQPAFLKSARGGYDGRSQLKLAPDASLDARQQWETLGAKPCVLELALDLAMEISVLVARTPSGELLTYPSARNHHAHQILVWSVIPSSIPEDLEQKAQALARKIAEDFQLEGLLAVEMFLTTSGDLLVNELAPRPHNSYHASEYACQTSQFEQAVRAVCDLPLGSVEIIQPAAIVNLLGDLWLDHTPRFESALAVPGVHLHLYEKSTPRKGRKMGHLAATAATSDAAVALALDAYSRL